MQRVDAIMRAAPPQASQGRAMKALFRLELKHANLNVAMVHKIVETSTVVIMELSNGSNS